MTRIAIIKNLIIIFAICCAQYLFIQLILPLILPELFHGDGLLHISKDSIIFHQRAIEKANLIHQLGWGIWELKPNDHAPVGIASALYYFFPSLISTIPLCALLQTISSFVLMLIVNEMGFSAKSQKIAGFLYVFHPISLQWNSQHHKDCYSILGIFLIVFALLYLFRTDLGAARKTSRSIATALVGFFLIWLVRAYLIEIIFLALFLAMLPAIIFTKNHRLLRLAFIPFICILIFFSFDELMDQKAYTNRNEISNWNTSHYLPHRIDKKIEYFARNRVTFIQEKMESGTINKNGNHFKNAGDVFLFLPLSLLDSLVEPVPFKYLDGKQGKGSKMISIMASLDMIVSYFLTISFFIFLFINKSQNKILGLTFFLMTILLIIGFSFPNFGTMYRMRYPFFMIILALGFAHFHDYLVLRFFRSIDSHTS
jgi:putative peptidoglycan lipid II flippase